MPININNIQIQVHPEFTMKYFTYWNKQLGVDMFVKVLDKYSNTTKIMDLTPALPLKLIKFMLFQYCGVLY